TWIPDDVLKDNDPYHIFKLFTDDEFPNHGMTGRVVKTVNGMDYHRFGGGLPYRVDHIAQDVVAMAKMRDYNDHFTKQQIAYQFLLLSHYVTDAHVPMHCDLRDDPPSDSRGSQPSRRRGSGKPAGNYMRSDAHAKLEELWDKAVTPVAVKEGHVRPEWAKHTSGPTAYSPQVTFTFDDAKKTGAVKVPTIPDGRLMGFLIDICVTAKDRGRILFPVATPQTRDDAQLPALTRQIFADAIGDLIAIWNYIWAKVQ
ncbi:MAG: hypothetical protein ABFS86_17710, partial [Planctomycetota bacterium]